MKRPFLSSTDTSTCTVDTSLLKVGRPIGKSPSPFFLKTDSTFCFSSGGFSSGASGFAFLRGFATVSVDFGAGPCHADTENPAIKAPTNNSAIRFRLRMDTLLACALYQHNLRRMR